MVETLPTFLWFLAERLMRRSLVLPSDSPDRVRQIMQFVEKRIIRETPLPSSRVLKCIFRVWAPMPGPPHRDSWKKAGSLTAVYLGLPK